MRKIWLALICAAATVLPAASAASAVSGEVGLTAANPSIASVRVHRGDGGTRLRESRNGDRDDDRPDRRRGRSIYVHDYYGGEWALYNNRSWDPDSFNDWWHERPHRSTPRWLQRESDCQRQYWSADGWTC